MAKEQCLYFRNYKDLTIRLVYLDNVQPAGKMMKIKMFSKIGGFQNVTGDMKHMGDATGGLKHGDEL